MQCKCNEMCKIEFRDKEFKKIKRSNSIELFEFSIEKVLKKYGKRFLKVWGPCNFMKVPNVIFRKHCLFAEKQTYGFVINSFDFIDHDVVR